MQKPLFVLLFLLIASPAHSDQFDPVQNDTGIIGGVSNNTQLPLIAVMQGNNSQASQKSFQGNEVEGWFQQTGDWYIKGVVAHHRLRCATYQLGIQLGKGNPSCLNVEWLTAVNYGTMQEQCNSASVQHVGGGNLPELRKVLDQATCVQISIKCSGACGQ